MYDAHSLMTRRNLLTGCVGLMVATPCQALGAFGGRQEDRSGDGEPPHMASSRAAPAPALARSERRLSLTPPPLIDAIKIDLNEFNPQQPYPGWDGRQPSQSAGAPFPHNRDLLILGHRSRIWTGRGAIRGGRNIHWLGGVYAPGPYARNFVGDAMVEGTVTDFPFAARGQNTGDGVTLAPDPETRGSSTICIANCRINNIDGFKDGNHGDCFQLPANFDRSGWASCPGAVHIERLTGSTGYQGLFLAAQNFATAAQDRPPVPRILTLRDVNLRQTRANLLSSNGTAAGKVNLLYMADTTAHQMGDRPYPRHFENIYLEPLAGVRPLDCVFPDQSNRTRAHPLIGLLPILASDERSLTFEPGMLTRGTVRFGSPPGGDFAHVRNGLRGGRDAPGLRYVSPGYGRRR